METTEQKMSPEQRAATEALDVLSDFRARALALLGDLDYVEARLDEERLNDEPPLHPLVLRRCAEIENLALTGEGTVRALRRVLPFLPLVQ